MVCQLISMGFGEADISRALSLTGSNLERSISILSKCASDRTCRGPGPSSHKLCYFCRRSLSFLCLLLMLDRHVLLPYFR